MKKRSSSIWITDGWERFDETFLPDKEAFYCNVNMEDIMDAGHKHAKRV